MKILDRYILGKFFNFLLFATVASIVIFVTVDLIENLDKFIDASLGFEVIFRYYYLFLPFIIYLTLPVSVLLATLFTVGGLVTRNEMTAMQSAGYSLWRILGLLMVMAIPLSAAILVFGETVVPAANHEKKEIYRTQIRKSSSPASSKQGRLYIQVGRNEFLRMESYDPESKTASLVSFQTFKDNRIVSRMDALQLHFQGDGWMLRKVYTREFNDSTAVGAKKDSLLRKDLGFAPQDLERVYVEPEELNYFDLASLVERLKSSGIRAEKWMVDLAFKIASPFATVIIVLFGVPFAAFRRRGGLVLGFGLSLLVCFVFFGSTQVFKVLGYNETVNPYIAAWASNVIFGILGLIFVMRVPK